MKKFNDVDEYLNGLETSLREIAEKLRQTVVATSKELKEEIRWSVPTYSINKDICSIMAHKNHVNLQIFQGAKIMDFDLLEGSGKRMRHLKFKELNDVNVTKIKRCLKQAIELDKSTE